MTDNPNDRQVDGNHYDASYQHWDLIFDLSHTLEYLQGCATKYAARWRRKYAGDPETQIKDLQKIVHYVDKMLWIIKDDEDPVRNTLLSRRDWSSCWNSFEKDNGLIPEDALLIRLILFWETEDDLKAAAAIARALESRWKRTAPAPAAMPPAPAAPAPSAHFTRPALRPGAMVAHTAPTARRSGAVGTLLREVGSSYEIKYDLEDGRDFITVDKHFVKLAEMESPFGFDQQEG